MQNEPIFIGCMLLFLGTMSMVTLADHPIVLWIAIEATTLVSAPLIFINRSKKALEATWKYVLICSVGIALALLGCFFITLSMDIAGIDVPLTFTSLNAAARQLGSALAEGGLYLRDHRFRHQDGSGADAHLAARRPQPGPQPGLGPACPGPCSTAPFSASIRSTP